ncbi:hypothetical protein CHH28_16545 [Bacterioplanes sanyensis]|uniref:NarX-like N-terminal domain-containing protein n=1 Tax=Bacterioplanes sanyensis TaxID=1249553 RepID=A0A222FMC8_9GAMM|nr:hypothetical protein [Bacterioplanes sanyensis]ASP40185.1 hypothetical protein CHH28_16545 [Bacterioplanes sanyensis]
MFRLLLCGMIWVSGTSWASQSDLLLFEALAHRSTADASLIFLRQGDGLSRQRLQATLLAADDQAALLRRDWPELVQAWQASRTFIEQNLEIAANNADVRFPVNLDGHQQALYADIVQAQQQADSSGNQQQLAMLQALTALEQVVAGYLYFNINIFGGLSVTDNTIETAAEKFTQALPALPANLRQRLQRKWQFVEKAILDYNQSSAVFIVRRTTDSMREMIITELGAAQP